jgi:type IV secretory pathway VirB10-like protein
MKKNNLLPILLVAGAGVAAYFYFKNKKASKEIAEGVDIEPIENKTSSEDQSTTTSEEPLESKGVKLIKSAASILKKGKQLIRGRKKRRSTVQIGPTESSDKPFEETATTRKNRRLAKRTEQRTARKTKRTTRKETRTARKSARKSKVVTGFEF